MQRPINQHGKSVTTSTLSGVFLSKRKPQKLFEQKKKIHSNSQKLNTVVSFFVNLLITQKPKIWENFHYKADKKLSTNASTVEIFPHVTE